MKAMPVLLSILIILSIWTPFTALAISSKLKIPESATSSAVQSVTPGTQIENRALESEISHPTPVSGSDSSVPSGQEQTGSDQGQMGSDHEQMGGQEGQIIWQEPLTYPGPVTTYPIENNNLWIDTSQGRMQYAAVPQYSRISLIASTSLGGQGVVYELYPIAAGQGTYTTNTYSFVPGDHQLGFVANIVGRHVLIFSINNQISNGVAIDVQSGINPLAQQSNGGLLGQGTGVY